MGMSPFLLLDGHQSRFDVEFLTCVNDPPTKWQVCLGVPYGTALWQVADSSEQNGVFKMELAKAKKNLYDNRIDGLQGDLHIIKTDIIPLVNEAWPLAFCNINGEDGNHRTEICF